MEKRHSDVPWSYNGCSVISRRQEVAKGMLGKVKQKNIEASCKLPEQAEERN